MTAFWLIFLTLFLIPVFVGIGIGRWWCVAVPLMLVALGVLFAFTLSDRSGYEGPSERGIVLVITLWFGSVLFVGTLIGTIIGKLMRR